MRQSPQPCLPSDGGAPAGWVSETLESIAARSPNAIVGGPFGSDLVSRDYVEDGVPVVRGQNMAGRWVAGPFVFVSRAKASALEANLAAPGDLVFTQRGTLGQVCEVPAEPYPRYLISQSQMKVTLDSKCGVPSFYYYYFSAPAQQDVIRKSAIQTGVPHINLGILKQFAVVVPPISEQRDISAVLSDVDALLTSLDQLLVKKRDLKQAAMQQLLSGRTRLPGFRDVWRSATIGDVADVKTGPFGSSLHESDYVDAGTPIITVEHLGERSITRQNLPLVSDEDCRRLRAYSLEAGDVVFSRVGSVDRNALVTGAESGWLFSGRLLRVRIKKGRADPAFLSHQFHSEPFKQRVREVAVGQTMPSLNTQILRRLPVALPSLAEQRAIAKVLSDMDAELAALEVRRDKTRQIKNGMMQALLTGRIRLV